MQILWLIAALLIQGGAAPVRNGVISGRVLNSNGSAAAGVRVSAIPFEPNSPTETAPVIAALAGTDREGHYRLENLPPGRYSIIAGPLDSTIRFPDVVTVRGGSAAEGIDFVLPLRIAATVAARQLLSYPEPVYPPDVINDVVTMNVVITRNGAVKDIVPTQGQALQRKAAVNAVKTWVYRPYLVDGAPVDVAATVTVIVAHGGVPPAGERGVLRVNSNVMEGHLLKQVDVPASGTQVRANVILDIIVGKDGTVRSVIPLQAHPLMAGVAVDAVKQWRYSPYILNGEAVEVVTTVQVLVSMASR